MELSPTQKKAVEILRQHGGKIIRLPGGFWTYHDCPKKWTGQYPEWSVDIKTIRVLERKGYLRRCNVFPEEWRDSRELI